MRHPLNSSVFPRLIAVMVATALLAGCSSSSIDQPPSPPPPAPPQPPPPPPPLPPPPPPGQVTAIVAIDTTVGYQVMSGWEATDQAGQESAGYASWRNSLMTQAADLGINRIRLELRAGAESPVDHWSRWRSGAISDGEWRNVRYQPVNDNASPTTANAAGFQFGEIDDHVEKVLVPLRQAVQARGGQLLVNLNYVGFGSGTQVHQDPDEYAELILVTFQHLQSKYGFVPDAVEPILEPDNGTLFDAQDVAAIIVATGDRLAAAGFHPEFIGPSTMSMASAVTYFDQMALTPRLFAYLKELSYHRYTGVSDANLLAIRARAEARGIRTAMLEHIGSGVEALYKDLTLANASAWQQYTLAYPTGDNGAQYFPIVNNQAVLGSRTRALRQYFRYVHLGARRVAVTSSKGTVRPVAFTNVGGAPVVVLHTDAAETYAIRGLRAGRYEVTSSSESAPVVGQATVGTDGELRFATTVTGVLTASWKS